MKQVNQSKLLNLYNRALKLEIKNYENNSSLDHSLNIVKYIILDNEIDVSQIIWSLSSINSILKNNSNLQFEIITDSKEFSKKIINFYEIYNQKSKIKISYNVKISKINSDNHNLTNYSDVKNEDNYFNMTRYSRILLNDIDNEKREIIYMHNDTFVVGDIWFLKKIYKKYKFSSISGRPSPKTGRTELDLANMFGVENKKSYIKFYYNMGILLFNPKINNGTNLYNDIDKYKIKVKYSHPEQDLIANYCSIHLNECDVINKRKYVDTLYRWIFVPTWLKIKFSKVLYVHLDHIGREKTNLFYEEVNWRKKYLAKLIRKNLFETLEIILGDNNE